MKTLLGIGVLLVLGQSLAAQGFEINLGAGIALSDEDDWGGVLVWPQYRVSDHFSVGFYTGVFVESEVEAQPNGELEADLSIVPLMATATYHFGSGKLVPFAGISLGVYNYNGDYVFRGTQGGRIEATETESYGAFGVHLGLNYALSDRWYLHLRTGLDSVNDGDEVFVGDDEVPENDAVIPFLIGVGVRF
ncbi:MAG: outer membrane beta-barrel protein [Bacteroidia bacterium]|nr:outer membrane beta-barrel protein [Bacteroidia bacterium]